MGQLSNMPNTDIVYYPTFLANAAIPQLSTTIDRSELDIGSYDAYLFAPTNICLPYGMYGRGFMLWLATCLVLRKNAMVSINSSREVVEWLGIPYLRGKGAFLTEQLIRWASTVYAAGRYSKMPSDLGELNKYKGTLEAIIQEFSLEWLSEPMQNRLTLSRLVNPAASVGETADEFIASSYIKVSPFILKMITNRGAVPLRRECIKQIFRHENKKRVALLFDMLVFFSLRKNRSGPYKEQLDWRYLSLRLCPTSSRSQRYRFKHAFCESFEVLCKMQPGIKLLRSTSKGIEYRKTAPFVSNEMAE